MKKYQLFLVTLVVCLLAFCNVALADTLEDDITALQNAESLNTQLALLEKITAENADKLEFGGWDISLNVSAAPDIPDGLIPGDWENMTYETVDGLPEYMQGCKFIALSWNQYSSEPIFAGDLLARFPADMRAGSLEEAEYALIVRQHFVPSGYVYSPPASSSHRDYEAYAVDLETGEMTCIWEHRNPAKTFGMIGQLDGNSFTQREIWFRLRPKLFGELRYTQEDGTELIFGINGENCFLMDFEGELTELDVPGSVDGYAVIEIADKCFQNEWNLKTVTLPEGLRRISDDAFRGCSAIESLVLPDTLESIGSGAFNHCSRLARLIFGEGIVELPSELFSGCGKMASCYFPASLESGLTGGLLETHISHYTTIYAPEGSYALQWAKENGYDHIICADPDEMPDFEYVTEGDFEFLICRDEAALSAYLGSDADVTVPEMAGDLPVTRVLYHAFHDMSFLRNVTLPQGIVTVHSFAIKSQADDEIFHLYVTNPETVIEHVGVLADYPFETITIHAPIGSLAERFVVDTNDEYIVFEPWGDGTSPDADFISDALKLAEDVQQNVIDFWETNDHKKYAWLGRVPDYDISTPDAAAVLHLTQEQFHNLALDMGGKNTVAAAFAYYVNEQWNLAYAEAAEKTAQSVKLDHMTGETNVFVALAYQTDIVLAVLQPDGSAQAALICSSPEIIEKLSPEYIEEITAEFGVSDVVCRVYKGDMFSKLLENIAED